jgi:hypothetical protein
MSSRTRMAETARELTLPATVNWSRSAAITTA